MNQPVADQKDPWHPWAQYRSHDWDHIIAYEARPEVRAQRAAERETREREREREREYLAQARREQRQQVRHYDNKDYP
jgi:dephospho-CoA kinase